MVSCHACEEKKGSGLSFSCVPAHIDPSPELYIAFPPNQHNIDIEQSGQN